MFSPKCIKNKIPCKTHEDGKYIKWSCTNPYSREERRLKFLSSKKPCKNCKKLCTRELCQKCYYKSNRHFLKGKKLPKWWCEKISQGQKKQELSPNWKGEQAGYWAKHDWMKKNYGNPVSCENCNKKGEKIGRNWNIDWANISGKYKRAKEDFKGLCRKCHIAFDKK